MSASRIRSIALGGLGEGDDFAQALRAGEVGDVVDGVIEADVLQRVGYRADDVVLADDGGHGLYQVYRCGCVRGAEER